ncbi:MAG: hypothetical protein HYV93_17575 [Candidatus Rokubacteria bacterium]|nr:hypothetical protein [Candidatus Rokubacteria bacterium]
MAPGITTTGAGADRIDPSITDRLLQASRAERVAVVFPQGDALFGHLIRGRGALRALDRRAGPYLVIDETAPGIAGHGGATGGRFALRYGLCLAEFLSAESLPPGRFSCPDGQEWAAARELLLRPWPAGARLLRDGSQLPPDVTALAGLWYGLMGESVIVVGLLEPRGASARVLYRAATPRVSGRAYAGRVEGGELRARLGSAPAASIAVRPAADGAGAELVWTSADGGRTLHATLTRAGPVE